MEIIFFELHRKIIRTDPTYRHILKGKNQNYLINPSKSNQVKQMQLHFFFYSCNACIFQQHQLSSRLVNNKPSRVGVSSHTNLSLKFQIPAADSAKRFQFQIQRLNLSTTSTQQSLGAHVFPSVS